MSALQRIDLPAKPSLALEFRIGTSPEEWEEVGRVLYFTEQAVQWKIGDWWCHSVANFGERWAREAASRIWGVKGESARNYGWVAEKFDPVRRLTELKFSHYQAVASLPPQEAAAFVKRAFDERLNVHDLRREVQALKAANDPGISDPSPKQQKEPRNIADIEREAREANEAVVEFAEALKMLRDLSDREGRILARARNYLADVYSNLPNNERPEDFEVIFVEHGRVECENWYRARRTTIDRWLIECGKPRLIAQRAAFIAHKRAMRKGKADQGLVALEPKLSTASDDLYPMAKRAAHFLRDPRNGGWIVSRADDGDWWVGNRKRTADDMIAMAERKGFDSIAAKAEIDNAEDHW